LFGSIRARDSNPGNLLLAVLGMAISSLQSFFHHANQRSIEACGMARQEKIKGVRAKLDFLKELQKIFG
jgi:hypothetical protein